MRGASTPISSLGRAIERLNGVNTSNVARSLGELSAATGQLSGIGSSLDSIREFRSGVNSLAGSIQRLNEIDLTGVEERVQDIVRAIRPMTDEMLRAGSGISNFGRNLRDMVAAARGSNSFNQVNQQLEQFNTRATKANRSASTFGSTLRKFVSLSSVVLIFREIGQALSKAISLSTEYVEAMNLATVSLGEMADEAKEFAENISDALGVDAGEALENMGLFQNLATSFGVANDQAYILSKGMTQLAYDFASFHDLDIEDSFLKFQSALAGELEPIRRVGVDISNARLQQELYDLGLQQNISTLNRADKAILTYIAIMKQSTNEMGDMARTIQSPSNMLRVLGNQFTITARQIGNIFIPALQAILPWVISIVKVVGQLAAMLASLVGYELPDTTIDLESEPLGGISDGLDDIGDSADSASKKINQLIGGFDELNILQKSTSSADSNIGVGSVLGNLDLSKFQYDMLSNVLLNQLDTYTEKVTEFLRSFDNNVAIKALSKAIKFLWDNAVKPLGEWIVAHPNEIANMLTTIGAAIVTYSLVSSLGSLASGFISVGKAIKNGGLLSGLSSLAGIITKPWAVAIAAVAAGIVALGLALAQAKEDAKNADLESRFGNIALTMEEVQQVAESLTSSEYTFKLKVYTDELDGLNSMYENLSSIHAELQKQQWEMSIGVDVNLEEYSSNVDTFIGQVQSTIEQQKVVANMTVDMAFTSESKVQEEMSAFADEYFANAEGELSRLGEELRAAVDSGLADGILSDAELQTVANLQAEMLEIVARVADAEYKAKLTALQLDMSGTDITAGSFADVMESAGQMIETQMQQLDAVRLEGIKLAELKLAEDGDQEAYKAALEDIQNNFNQQTFELQFETFSFGMDTILSAYETELETEMPAFASATNIAVQEAFSSSWDDADTFNLSKFFSAVEATLNNDFDSVLTPAMKANISDLLDVMEPEEARLQELRDAYLQAGKDVPDYISQGLSDINMLKAITGDTAAIYELIGGVIESDPEIKTVFTNMYNSGADITQEVINGMATKNEALEQAGRDVANGIYSGTSEELTQDKTLWQGLFGGIIEWVKGVFDSHSPSKVFAKIGGDNVEGLLNGSESRTSELESQFKNTFDDIISFAKESLGFGVGKTSSMFESIGGNIMESLKSGLNNALTSIKTWWNTNIKNAFGADVKVETTTKTRSYSSDSGLNYVDGIPQFASGNVATDPTLAIFGEYPGAKHNPEVTAPESTIYETVVAANGEMVGAVYQMAEMIVQAIEDNATEISADSKGIFNAVKKRANNYQKAHGVPAF